MHFFAKHALSLKFSGEKRYYILINVITIYYFNMSTEMAHNSILVRFFNQVLLLHSLLFPHICRLILMCQKCAKHLQIIVIIFKNLTSIFLSLYRVVKKETIVRKQLNCEPAVSVNEI